MNLVIKLPPKAERDEIVDAWINGVLIEGDYSEFNQTLNTMVKSGFNHNGIICLFLHETTTKLIQQRVKKLRKTDWAEVAFAVPISLN